MNSEYVAIPNLAIVETIDSSHRFDSCTTHTVVEALILSVSSMSNYRNVFYWRGECKCYY